MTTVLANIPQSNMRISWPNRLGDATFSEIRAGAWSTSLPLSYLNTKQIAQVARSAALTGATVLIDAGSAVEIGTFAAVGHNLTTAGKIRLRGYTTNPKGSWYDFTVAGTAGSYSTSIYGTYYGSDGLLHQSASNAGRFQHTFKTGGACLGLLLEPERTNHLLYCRDMTNGAWSASSMTVARTVTGIDGVANTACRLTSTGAVGSVTQQYIAGAATRRLSIYARRVSGSGLVYLSSNEITLTTSWQRFDVAMTGGNPQCQIQVWANNDIIEVDFMQLEDGSYPTMPIPTTSGEVTRTADQFTLGTASHNAGTLLVQAKVVTAPSATEGLLTIGAFGTNGHGIAALTTSHIDSRGYNGSTQQWGLADALASTQATIAYSYVTNSIIASDNGTAADPTDTSATVGSYASWSAGTSRTGVYLLKLAAWWDSTSTAADVESLSALELRETADYDSGEVDAWPAAWVAGTTAEQRAGVVGCSVLAPDETYRYWRLDLIDAANPDGYIEVGRLFGGSAWQPTRNALFGASIGHQDRDVVTEMDSGSEYMRSRPSPRVVQFALQSLSDVESFGAVLEMQRRLGSSGEVLYEWDPSDTLYSPSRRFLARLSKVSPLRAAFVDRWESEFEVKELL